jgi:hypothetical protein
VTWTITNGSPATWVGPTVTIHAGESGKVEISAIGEKEPCKSTASDSLSVEIVKQLSCDHPTVGRMWLVTAFFPDRGRRPGPAARPACIIAGLGS